MKPSCATTLATISLAVLTALTAAQAKAQTAKDSYPSMAPVEQYLIADRDAEIALARSAAPESISHDADVMVLGRHGYETAAKGKNGFVCMVQRSWTAGSDDPDFWNPKLRAPICFNAAAAQTYMPLTIRKTELILSGRSKAEMFHEIEAGLASKKLPRPEPGAMCYMMSKTRLSRRSRQNLASASDVFHAACRTGHMGCGLAWLAGSRV